MGMGYFCSILGILNVLDFKNYDNHMNKYHDVIDENHQFIFLIKPE